MSYFDKNKRLVCPNCHKSDGVGLVWAGGSSYFGQHEEDFVCCLCRCEFTVKYKIEEIVVGEEDKKND